MAVTKWTALTGPTTDLDTGLNSLAAAARAISAAIDNTADKNRYADFELVVTFGVAPVLGTVVSLFVVPSIDGTNYVDGDASIDPPDEYRVGNFPVRAVTTAQRIAARGIVLPPTKFKVLVRNDTAQAFAASGNTVKRVTYNEETA